MSADALSGDTPPHGGGDDGRLKIFISYSRQDAAAADAIVRSLAGRGFSVKIDTRDLPFGEKWQAELAEFIRLSDTVVWLVSEPSIKSHWVNWELDEVARRNKRLVPVMVGDTDRGSLPRQLGEIHILPAAGVFSIERDLDALATVLETDRAWLQEASRLADRAHEWLARGRGPDLLLRRAALSAAEGWKERRPAKAPAPAQEIVDLILASRQAATRRQRMWIGGLSVLTAGAVALSAVAWMQRTEAQQQRDIARAKSAEALTNLNEALTNQSRLLARLVRQEIANGDAATAMALAIEALPDADQPDSRPLVTEAADGLREAAGVLNELTVIEPPGEPYDARLSPNGDLVLTGSTMADDGDRAARLYNATSGKLVGTLEGHSEPVAFVAFNTNGRLLYTIGDQTLRVWETETRQQLAVLRSQRGFFSSALFSNDYSRIWVGESDGTVSDWAWQKSGEPKVIGKLPSGVDAIVEDEFPTHVAAVSDDGSLMIWNAKTLKPTTASGLKAVDGHKTSIELVMRFDGSSLITRPSGTPFDGVSAKVWDPATGSMVGEIALEPATVEAKLSGQPWDVAFAAAGFDGGRPKVAIAQTDGFVRFSDGVRLPRAGAQTALRSRFAPRGEMFAAAVESGTINLWHRHVGLSDDWSSPAVRLAGHVAGVRNLSFRDNVQRLLSVSSDGTLRIWSTAVGQSARSADDGGETVPQPVWDLASAVDAVTTARDVLPRCLTQGQRKAYLLPQAPPRWCITGRGGGSNPRPGDWVPLWPYKSEEWKDWLVKRDRGEDAPLPTAQN